MISVKKELFRQRNLCHTTNDTVRTIQFRYDGSAGGTSVMLCKNCRKELVSVLNNYDKE